MAVTYVDISREELEEWLDSLGKKWTRDRSTAGIYLIHLSDNVAVKLSSTQTSSSSSVGYADASMKLSLVSLKTGQLLNKKDADRTHFKRTLNWKKTWKEGVAHWESVYDSAKGFYERIAVVEDRSEYKKTWMAKIESVPNWESQTFLSQLHEKLSKNSILSEAQEEAIVKFVKNLRTAPVQVEERPSVQSQYKEEWLSKIESVPNWQSQDFLSQIHEKVKKGLVLSQRQEEAILKFVNNVRSRPVEQRPVEQRPVVQEAPSTQVRFTPEQERAMLKLEALVEVATPVDKTFTMIMINKAKKGIKLTDEEKQKLIGLLRQYNI